MPRGRSPTGTVATVSILVRSMTLMVLPFSFETYAMLASAALVSATPASRVANASILCIDFLPLMRDRHCFRLALLIQTAGGIRFIIPQ